MCVHTSSPRILDLSRGFMTTLDVEEPVKVEFEPPEARAMGVCWKRAPGNRGVWPRTKEAVSSPCQAQATFRVPLIPSNMHVSRTLWFQLVAARERSPPWRLSGSSVKDSDAEATCSTSLWACVMASRRRTTLLVLPPAVGDVWARIIVRSRGLAEDDAGRTCRERS